MKVVFGIPQPAQRIGGLDAAIDGLRQALNRHGINVAEDLPPTNAGGVVAHLHGLWQRSHLAAARDCTHRGIPYIVSPHGMLEPWAWRHKWWKKWPYYHLVEKGYLNRASAVLATAPAEAERLRKFLPRQRIETLPLGLTGEARPDYENARRALGWQSHERVLLFLSRIHVKKGLDLLLQALAGMALPADVRLVIVGDGAGNYVQELQRFAKACATKLPPIEWKGAVWGEARWPYFQGADLFCLPTHSENFGLAVLESCQVGTPALTTTATPWAEALSGGRGFIGRPLVEDIRGLLGEFFAQPRWSAESRRALSEWAWTTFHWDRLAERYTELYTDLIRGAHDSK